MVLKWRPPDMKVVSPDGRHLANFDIQGISDSVFSTRQCQRVVIAVATAALSFATRGIGGTTVPAGSDQGFLVALARDDPESAARLARPQAESGQRDAQFVLGLLCDVGAGVRLDHPQALQWLEKSAAQGSPLARLFLAWKYETGFGLDKADADAAAKWRASTPRTPHIPDGLSLWIDLGDSGCVPNFRRALMWMMDRADDGYPVAYANLAEVYLATQWTPPSVDQHLLWLRKAAEGKDAGSLERLAEYYQVGLFVPKDPDQALKFRREAAEAGSAKSQETMGEQFENGNGVPVNVLEAVKWYRMAAAQNDAAATDRLISIMRDGAPGLKPNEAEAVELAERGAAQGDPEATADLADFYSRGAGVKRDLAKAIELDRKAADRGLVRAIESLGWIYQSGAPGTPNYAEARRWYEMAAAKGSDYARRQLGAFYEYGQGVPKDPKQAFIWYERAARDGDGFCQNKVGWFLREGVGIERDDEEAAGWFRLAAKNGEPLGDANLAFLYLKGRGVPRDPAKAFAHLAAASRQLDDRWVNSQLGELLFESSDADRQAIKGELKACIEDPALAQAKGALPELCLQAADEMFQGDAEAIAAPLTQRLLAAHRPKSAVVLAWRVFTGWHTPYDLDLARKLARAAAANDAADGTYLLAAIDSVSADAPDARAAARASLHRLADGGFGPAALMLARRYASGVGEGQDPTAAVKYFKLALGKAAAGRDFSFESVCRSLGVKVTPVDAPAEAPEATEDLGPTAPPQVISQPPPPYPYDLRISGLEGDVTVDCTIDRQGVVQSARVVTATHPLFAAAAVTGVRRWRFRAARKDYQAQPSTVRVSIRFRIDEDGRASVSAGMPLDPSQSDR